MRVFTLLAVLLVSLPLWAAKLTSYISGVVTFPSGVPVRGAVATFLTQNEAFSAVLDDQGRFAMRVPGSYGALLVLGETKSLYPRQNSTMTVTPDHGVIVHVSGTDGAGLAGSYRTAQPAAPFLPCYDMGQGQFWFPDVPSDATDFAVTLPVPHAPLPCQYAKLWTLTPGQPAPITVEWVLPQSQPVTCTRVDKKGQPVANAPVNGHLTATCLRNPAPWAPTADNVYTVDIDLNTLVPNARTDAKGNFDLGALPPQTYTITFDDGVSKTITVNAPTPNP